MALSLLLSAAAAAQPQGVDQSALIDALAEEEMRELLLHLIETQPMDDPVVQAKLEIAQHKLAYRDQALPRDERAAALVRAIERTRRLIEDLPEHPQRPMWQTDLAELLLERYLKVMHRNAAAFYEFGVPSASQREAYETAAVDALEALAQADLRFFQLQSALPRQENFTREFVNTGLWPRMMEEYYEKRTPFYHALAAHLVSLLPPDHPYFQQPNPRVPNKLANPQQERERLSALALQKIERFTGEEGAQAGVRLPAITLKGRALLASGQPEAAVQAFEEAVSENAGDFNDLLANIGIGAALGAQEQYPSAVDRLAALAEHPAARDDLLNRLLVVDAAHRVLMQQAANAPEAYRADALAAAYEPYLTLLNDESLGEQVQALERYVFQRWAEGVQPGIDLTTLPPVVRMGIGEMLRIQGQNAAVAAQQAGQPVPSEAQAHLRQAVALNKTLIGEEVPQEIRGRALYNLGLARYFASPGDLSARLAAAEDLVRLAEEMPGQARAEEAIAYAVQILREPHAVEPRPAGVEEAYRQAVEVLLEKYPTSAAADSARLYYAVHVLEPAGEYGQAVEVLNRLPRQHPDFSGAQQEALYALEQMMRQAEGDARVQARQALAEQAQQVLEESQANGDSRAAASARLALAATAMEAGDTEQALEQLDGFEQQFPEQDDLTRIALERRILALARTDQLERLAETARAMMEAYPANAAAVIDQVLTRLDEQIGELRRQAAETASAVRQRQVEQQAQTLAETSSRLARLLVQWAEGQDLDAREMLPYRLVYARSLRLASEPEQAAEVTAGLAEVFPTHASVLHERAESLYHVGTQESLQEASELYDTLIRGMQAPYPDEWWNAWMRRLQIQERLREDLGGIALRVRQLRNIDPALHGEPYTSALEALEVEYTDEIGREQAATDETVATPAEDDGQARSVLIGLSVVGVVALVGVGIALSGRKKNAAARRR